MKTILEGSGATVIVNENNINLISIIKKDRCNEIYTLKIVDKNSNEILNMDVTKEERDKVLISEGLTREQSDSKKSTSKSESKNKKIE